MLDTCSRMRVRARLSDHKTLLAIMAGALALRVLYLFTVGRNEAGLGDWHFYTETATLLADGHGFIDPFAFNATGAEIPSAKHAPLYPVVLAPISLLGFEQWLAHRALGLILGPLTVGLIWLLGKRVGGPTTGLIAAAIAAVYPVFIAVDGALMSEVLYSPLFVGVLLLAYRLLDRPSARIAAVLGVAIALAALTRTEALLLIPCLALPVAWRAGGDWRGRGALAAAACVACTLTIAPWTIRNWSAFDRPVPISTQGGALLAGANCESTYHGDQLGHWDFSCISPTREENEALQSEIWRDEGLEYAGDHVGRLPLVAAVRLLKGWELYDPNDQVQYAEGRDRGVQRAGIVVYYALAALALYGAVLLRRRRETLLILAAPVILVSIASVTGYGFSRLRHAAEFSIVVLAAFAISSLRERRAARPA
jgi:hypothetical protein